MIFVWPTMLPAATAVMWRDKLYQFVGPSTLFTVRGELHH